MTTVKLGKLLVSFETFNLNGINFAAFCDEMNFYSLELEQGKTLK